MSPWKSVDQIAHASNKDPGIAVGINNFWKIIANFFVRNLGRTLGQQIARQTPVQQSNRFVHTVKGDKAAKARAIGCAQ